VTRRGEGFPAFAPAFRELRRIRPYLDAYIEVLDARAPARTRVPSLTRALDPLPHLTLLSRRDLAREELTRLWLKELAPALAVDLRHLDVPRLLAALRRECGSPHPRLAVLGAPNVGKSTLVNRLVGRRAARVGMSAGVTRGPQWIRTPEIEILDLPGLPPLRPTAVLEALGVVPEGSTSAEEALAAVWPHLEPSTIVEPGEGMAQAITRLGTTWGLLETGGWVSETRTAQRLLSLLRRGKLGPVTVDRPQGSP